MKEIKIYYLHSEETEENDVISHEMIIKNPKSACYTLKEFENGFNNQLNVLAQNQGWIAIEEVEQQSSSDVTVNIVELASELAHDAARDEMMSDTSKGDYLINDEEEMWRDDNGTDVYTEQAQEVFNRQYDFYYEFIERFKQ